MAVIRVLLIQCSLFGLGYAGSCKVEKVPFPFTDGVEEIRLIRETLHDIAASLRDIGESITNNIYTL